MALPAFASELLSRLSPLLARLPLLPKKKSGTEEPFGEIDDRSPDFEENLAPNALPPKGKSQKAAALDVAAIFRDLIARPIVVAAFVLFLVFVVAIIAVSIYAQSAPPAATAAKLSTPEGRAAASRLLLPPDPASDLSPPMERERHFPYTDEDLKRLSPARGPAGAASLAERNDRAMQTMFGAVP